MNQEETNVLQLLTGKSKFDDVSLNELEELATNYPFFSAAQLLLLKKMQQVAHPNLQQQGHKTALYFPNEQWLRYLLLESAKQNNNDPKSAVKNNHFDTELKDAKLENEPESVIINEAKNNVPEPQIITTENEPEKNIKPDDVEDERKPPKPAEPTPEPVSLISHIHDEPEEAELDDDELQQQSEPLPLEESQQKIAHLLSEQAGVFHKPVEEKEDLKMEADPFHTVDYFASQGIKLDGKKEENTLDKKVHKFTDWLRQMKRINPHPVDLGTDSEEENHVANIAASSNQTKEIVTESMAQVLAKQGKQTKAIEVYQKLGLLYPHKIAYFAAKIQEIKQ